MIVKPSITRLGDEVPALSGRVRGAADYTSLLRGGSLPQAPAFAYVLYGGIARRGDPQVAVGDFRQPIARGIKIVVFYRTTHPEGARLVDDLEEMARDILKAFCGWRPGNEIGVFQLAGASVNDFRDGILSQQIDLTISDHLRFT